MGRVPRKKGFAPAANNFTVFLPQGGQIVLPKQGTGFCLFPAWKITQQKYAREGYGRRKAVNPYFPAGRAEHCSIPLQFVFGTAG